MLSCHAASENRHTKPKNWGAVPGEGGILSVLGDPTVGRRGVTPGAEAAVRASVGILHPQNGGEAVGATTTVPTRGREAGE